MYNKSIVYYSLLCAMGCSFLFKESALCMESKKTAVKCNQVQSNPVARLYRAILANDSKSVESVLDECSVQEANTAMQGLSAPPLGYAIASQSEDLVAALLASNKIDVNAPIAGTMTAFESAVLKGNIGMLNALLACARVNVNVQMADGNTALGYAVLSGDIGMLNALLACERVNVNVPMADGYTALEFAIAGQKHAILKALLQREDLDIAGTGPIGVTPLDLAKKAGNHEIIKLLEDELERRRCVAPSRVLPIEDID